MGQVFDFGSILASPLSRGFLETLSMSRPLRLEFAGALYHITSRGDRREDIYEDDANRASFLSILDNTCDICNWASHAD